VAFNARIRETRDVPKRNPVTAFEPVRQATEPRAQDQADDRLKTVGEPLDLAGRRLRRWGGQASTPASDAVIQVATVPPSMARIPSFDRSCLRSGAIPPMPPI